MAPPVPEVLARIAERDAARKQRATDATADREEAAGGDAAEAEQQLSNMQLAIDARLRSSIGTPGHEQELTAISADIERLEQHVARSAWLLPPYALRKAEDGAASLRQQLQAAQTAAKPKRKFGFSSRSRGTADAAAPSAQPTAQPAVQPAASPAASAEPGPQPEARHDSTLRGLRAQKVVKWAAELAGGDFTLADLEDCTVLLLGRLPALRILQARRCCIVAGPIDGAAYLEGVTDCQVALAAHQVRIHTSSGSSVFLDVGSNPVIEHCSAMGFGALTPQQRDLLGVPQSSAVQTATDASSAAPSGQPDSGSMGDGAMAQPQPTGAAAGAAGSGAGSCWRAVQDFNWLRSTPSPNWHVLTEDEISRAAWPSPD